MATTRRKPATRSRKAPAKQSAKRSPFGFLMFGILASIVVAAHSRRREFVADEGGAKLASKEGMIGALQTLSRQGDVELAGGLKAFGISGKQSKFFALFSTHPPLEDRIEKLLNQK